MTQLALNGASIGFEETLWGAADHTRGHTGTAECKHVIPRAICTRYSPLTCTRPRQKKY